METDKPKLISLIKFLNKHKDSKISNVMRQALGSPDMVEYMEHSVDPLQLTPTQNELDVVRICKPIEDFERQIVILNSKYVLDGHHHWAKFVLRKQPRIRVVDIQCPHIAPEDALMSLHITNSISGELPAQETTKFNAYSPEMIEKYPFLNDLPKPPHWAFGRKLMPQIDDESFNWDVLSTAIGGFIQ